MYALQPQDDAPMRMTEAEYLAFEEASEFRYEYSSGLVYAMTGGSIRHGVITANVSTQFNNHLAEKDCTVTSPNVRVYIAARNSYRYPDVTVFCGPPAYVPGRADTLTNPVVLVEVLSPGTEMLDRTEKLEAYMQIESLQAYLLVAQHTAKIERFLRHESGQWLYTYVTGLASEIVVPPLGCTLALSRVYHKVSFEADAASDN